ncbi:MAG: hypothetical protein F4210_06955 [Holophagales bacterium]|nr:hypothetical protein [Holophagales bacterium]MYF95234.1 hypothetical protein [Holophagales bacterium]
MSKKVVSAVLLLTFVFALAPAAGVSDPSNFAVPEGGPPVEFQQAGEPLLAAATGGVNWGCIGAVLGFSFGAMAAGAVFGPPGVAVIGAYAPIALVACA